MKIMSMTPPSLHWKYSPRKCNITLVKNGQPVHTLEYEPNVIIYREMFSKVRSNTVSSISRVDCIHYIIVTEDKQLTNISTIFMIVPFKHGFII